MLEGLRVFSLALQEFAQEVLRGARLQCWKGGMRGKSCSANRLKNNRWPVIHKIGRVRV